MLRPEELASLRAAATASLIDSCEVYSTDVQITDSGGSTAGTPTLLWSGPCRLTFPAKAGSSRDSGPAISDAIEAVIVLPRDAIAAMTNEIHIGADIYQIVAPVQDREPHITKQANCTRKAAVAAGD